MKVEPYTKSEQKAIDAGYKEGELVLCIYNNKKLIITRDCDLVFEEILNRIHNHTSLGAVGYYLDDYEKII